MNVQDLSLYVIQVGAGHTVGIRARQFGMVASALRSRISSMVNPS
jgi:hypothetical protein